jgi:hypothetical protein
MLEIFSDDQPCQYRTKNQRFRDILGLLHQGRYGEPPYVADIYTSLSNRCLFLLVYCAVGGRSQTVRSPIRLWPFTVLLNPVSLLSNCFVFCILFSVSSWDYHDVCVLVLSFHAWLSWNISSLFILSGCNIISVVPLTSPSTWPDMLYLPKTSATWAENKII